MSSSIRPAAVLAAIVCLLSLTACPTPAARVMNDDGYWEYPVADDVVLQWKVDGDDLNIIVSAPTEGWIGVGFDPVSRMEGANILIGWVDDGGVAHVRDDYGDSPTTHEPDPDDGGTDDVTAVDGTQSAGRTELRFTIPLDSGDDAHDTVLVEGQTHRFLVSYRSDDDITERHTGGPYWFNEKI